MWHMFLFIWTLGFSSYHADGFLLDGACTTGLTPQNCPLFNPGSDMVTLEQLKNSLTSAPDWINVYTYEILSDDIFGKCIYDFIPQGGDIFLRRGSCYDVSTKDCHSINVTLRLTADSCGRVRMDSLPGSDNETGQVYSQDPTSYFWYDICEGPTNYGNCTQRYFDLMVRASRVNNAARVADLTDLPLGKIATDLAKIMDKKFEDNDIRFAWIDKECPL